MLRPQVKEYIVQRIIKERRGRLEYLVEWDGCRDDGTPWPYSWEPAPSLANTLALRAYKTTAR